MALKIGFKADVQETVHETPVTPVPKSAHPRPSVVDVHFPHRGLTCSYYNDKFDLRRGDTVYVDGKLENYRGRVVSVNYNFKIKLSDYKRVIGVADTNVKGEFHMAGSHFVAFDPKTLPAEKVRTWFLPPAGESEFVSGCDSEVFCIDDLKNFGVSPAVADRGHDLYMENKVRYISIDGERGYAIVEGSRFYEIEFTYRNREISSITCDCYCSANCKHIFATVLQLRDILDTLETEYEDEYENSSYFSAICKVDLFITAIDGSEKGSISIG